MSNLVRMLEACVIVKFNFFPWGQLESLSLDKFFLTVFKILPCHEGFFGNLIFAIITRMFCRNHPNFFG